MKERYAKQSVPAVYRYKLQDEWIVLAGKTDHDNDLLTFRTAKANDYWFHAKGVAGSHVLLQTENREPVRQILKDAAVVAAYHSKARNSGKVTVSCTKAGNVRKSQKNKPGSVIISQEITLTVRPAEFDPEVYSVE